MITPLTEMLTQIAILTAPPLLIINLILLQLQSTQHHLINTPLHRSQLTAYEKAHMSTIKHNPSNAPGVYSQYSFFFKSALSQSRMEEICTWIEGFSALEKKMLSDILNDCRDQVQWDCNDTL